MKKIITTAVLIGIAGLAASPFIIGSKIKSTTEEQAQIADQQLKKMAKTNPYFKDAGFTLENYEKSFLKSNAQSLLRITTIVPDDNGNPLVIEIPMTSEITHGPYLGSNNFGLAKVVSRPDIEKMELPESITPDTVIVEDLISFSGEVNETLTVKPIKHDDGSDTTIEFAGAKAHIKTSADNRLNFKGDLTIEDIKISSTENEKSFTLSPIKIDMQGTGNNASSSGEYQLETGEIKGESPTGLTFSAEQLSAKGTYKPAENIEISLGEQDISITNIEINDPASLPSPVKIPEFKVTSVAEQNDKETINIAANYSAVLDPSLMAVFQSPVDIKTASIETKINSIPTSVLQTYMGLTQNLASEEESEASLNAIQEQLPGLLQTVINHSSSMLIAVKADTGDGSLESQIDLNLESDKELSKEEVAELLLAAAGDDPQAWLSIVSGKGHLHLDKSVTDKAQLTPMVQMMAADFVKLQGDAFKSELLIKDGQVLINNQPLPLFAPAPEPVAESSQEASDTTQESPVTDGKTTETEAVSQTESSTETAVTEEDASAEETATEETQ